MNKRERKRRGNTIRARQRAYNRRRHKKVPLQRIGKTHLSPIGVTQTLQPSAEPLSPPKDFRLLSNTEACINFFKKVRGREKAIAKNNRLEIRIDLSRIEQIDFASTMMLDAICDELASTEPICNVYGSSPRNEKCYQYLADSGFLDNKYNKYGRKYPELGHSANIKIERGQAKLKDEDIRKVVEIEKRICRHVTGTDGKKFRHINMIKEICGNTVDWSDAAHDQWIYGTKFEEGKVIVVALDLGKGILESISRKFSDMIKDMLDNYSHVEILEGAFNRKYGSKSGMPNRNRGLPSIKYANENGDIKDLVVITNNVVIDFTDKDKCFKFVSNKSRGFNGTLYSWCIDSSCY